MIGIVSAFTIQAVEGTSLAIDRQKINPERNAKTSAADRTEYVSFIYIRFHIECKNNKFS